MATSTFQHVLAVYKELASTLQGFVKVGAVDMTKHQSVGAPYEVRGFPTLKFFAADKSKPIDYDGARTTKDLAAFALKHISGAIKARLGISDKPKADSAASGAVRSRRRLNRSRAAYHRRSHARLPS
jgi:protein disulfide-isomerase A6